MALSVQPLANQPTLNPRVQPIPQPQANLKVQPLSPQPSVTPGRLPQSQPLSVQPAPVQQNLPVMDALGNQPQLSASSLDDAKKQELVTVIKRMEEMQLPPDKIKQVIQGYIRDNQVAPEPPAPEEPGFMQSLAQGLAGSALGRIPLSGIRFGQGLIDTAQGFNAKIGKNVANLVGNEDRANELQYKENEEFNSAYRNLSNAPSDLGYLGQVKPISTPEFTKQESFGEGAKKFRDNTGLGIDAGSYVIGGGGAKSVLANTLKGKILRGAGEGALYGAAGAGVQGFGTGLQREDATVGSVAKDTGLGILGGGVFGAGIGGASPIIGRAGRGILETIFPSLKNSANEFASVVDDYFTRAFKPSTAGIKTPQALEKARVDAQVGIATILDNIPDPANLPKTVDEALAANTATKKTILEQYQARSKAAGEQGASMDLNPIADELERIARDPKIQVVSPGTADYAADLAVRLRSQEKIDPVTAEDFLAGFNQRSKAYWNNPNPNEINNVLVDTLVTNKLRGGLIDMVETVADDSYSKLRQQYGALAQLEKTLTKAAARLQNKSAVGFFDGLGDILSAGDIMQGVLSGSPTQVARGFVTKGVGRALKALNDPDRLTAKLFKQANNAFQKSRGDIMPKAAPKFMKQLPAPKQGAPAVSNNMPINVPEGGFRLPPDADAQAAQLQRIGGRGSRRMINKELIKPGQVSAPKVKRPSPKQTKAMKARELARAVKGKGKGQLYSAAPGGLAGFEVDENGNLSFDSKKAGIGLAIGATVSSKKVKEAIFKGFKDITTKVLNQLVGKGTISKQFIMDLTNSGDLKQAERELIRDVLAGFPEGKINANEFANAVKTELLPLETIKTKGVRGMEELAEDYGSRYGSITLPDDIRGNVANYTEKIYQSPIKTSAGDTHFSGDGINNYFAHSRIEDMADEELRRVIEIQSDLFQKGRLEKEGVYIQRKLNQAAENVSLSSYPRTSEGYAQYVKAVENAQNKVRNEFKFQIYSRNKELKKLEPYRNTWQDRIIKEEVRQAAKDGKTKLQFPTGETAMNIEGLVNRADKWVTLDNELVNGTNIKEGDLITYQGHDGEPHPDRRFLITKNNGDGTFEAVDSMTFENDANIYNILERNDLLDDGLVPSLEELNRVHGISEPVMARLREISEQLSAQNTVDKNNPIYKFYEKEVGRYLKNRYKAELVTDENGVTWWELKVPKDAKNSPIEAFAALPAVPAALGAGQRKDK